MAQSPNNPNQPHIDPTTDDLDPKPTEHNKAGHQQPTSRNEPRRTPESRNDREGHVGSGNQIQSRRGSAGASR